jgi:hemerythrin-like domain-containing protein
MYRVHASRENTVLFPALKEVASKEEMLEIAEKFEEIETKKFGPKGDRSLIPIIEKLEKALSINDINKFTP